MLLERAQLPHGDPVALDRVLLGEVGAQVCDKARAGGRSSGLHQATILWAGLLAGWPSALDPIATKIAPLIDRDRATFGEAI